MKGDRKIHHELLKKIKDGSATEDDFQNWEDGICSRAVEEALRVMPNVVDHLTKQSFVMKKLSDNFYEKNKDLKGHKELVVQTIEKVEGENPGKNYREILEIVEPRVRNALQLKPKEHGKGVKREDLDEQIGEL